MEQLRKVHDRLVAEVEQKERELADLQRRVADRALTDTRNAAEIKEADVRSVVLCYQLHS